jgi:hypothetical protein
MQPDPYDQYDWLDKIHQALHLKPVYFFLLAKKRKGVDKNIHPSRKLFQELILQHAKKHTVGIHPSWQSGNNETLLLEEISNLEKIINSSNAHSSNTQTSVSLTSDAQLANTDSSIIHSRQHYLRMSLPETYQRLIRAGIKKDYTMGYGRTNGFRASYAVPHCWFDLSKDVITDLEIHPFCFMDTTAIFQNRSAVYDAFLELQELYDQVKLLGGEMVCIFHNQYLTNQPECIEWKNGYEIFLRKNSVTTQEK